MCTRMLRAAPEEARAPSDPETGAALEHWQKLGMSTTRLKKKKKGYSLIL